MANEWKNYGDVNFEEYGGVQLLDNGYGDYDFIEVQEVPGRDDVKYVVCGSINAADFRDADFVTEDMSDAEIAIAALDYYSALGMGAHAIGEVFNASNIEQCLISNQRLHAYLMEQGVIEMPEMKSLENLQLMEYAGGTMVNDIPCASFVACEFNNPNSDMLSRIELDENEADGPIVFYADMFNDGRTELTAVCWGEDGRKDYPIALSSEEKASLREKIEEALEAEFGKKDISMDIRQDAALMEEVRSAPLTGIRISVEDQSFAGVDDSGKAYINYYVAPDIPTEKAIIERMMQESPDAANLLDDSHVRSVEHLMEDMKSCGEYANYYINLYEDSTMTLTMILLTNKGQIAPEIALKPEERAAMLELINEAELKQSNQTAEQYLQVLAAEMKKDNKPKQAERDQEER